MVLTRREGCQCRLGSAMRKALRGCKMKKKNKQKQMNAELDIIAVLFKVKLGYISRM